ncbi:MAG TPA: hypothetical protein VI341_11005 [Actinomycetota bacterium]
MATPLRIRRVLDPRRSTFVVAFLTVALMLGSAAPAGAGGIPPGRYAIGDSVMLGASGELRGRGIKVNATVSRQFSTLPGLIRRLRSSGRLRETVIIHLGNNGFLELNDCKAAVRAASGRTVYLVTVKVPRQWRQENNRRLARCDRDFPRAHLVDWFRHSVNHPAWFADDLYHLTPVGQRRYAAFIS